ncbi:interferon-induced protein 44-like [Dicentrarchus labrax]|uniref:interferon-induced protein 44-like n=1 Tax=Dicentrarchus labrax TaxID=13489 RepID=UPI0021F698C0|nr:interferon-induced protein 44-like [Dicentrarchus labrax]
MCPTIIPFSLRHYIIQLKARCLSTSKRWDHRPPNVVPHHHHKTHKVIRTRVNGGKKNNLKKISRVEGGHKEVLEAMWDIREAANELAIPQVAILTKIDEACPEIQKDIKNVYKSIMLHEKMKEFSANSGIPINSIFAVKNYHEEIDLNSDADSLILSALRHINTGEDFLNPNDA